ncbi:DUF4152 family protein [Candidatus Bathyarchaeota archaeon]|nr:DUF4152 family protein [Candidatus Bathyarchaeota archaeon]
MKIIAADSAAAILAENFQPLQIVACAAVMVEPPYRTASECIAEPIFADIENGHELVIHELQLCYKLLKREKANVVHLDISLGGVKIEELSAANLSSMVHGRARSHILKILPKIRKISDDIRRTYKIDVLAIGKESIPVRIAELTAGAYAIIFTAKKCLDEKKEFVLGLPAKCQPRKGENGIYMHSLIPAEHDIVGFAEDKEKIMEKVMFQEILNPCARGFRAVKMRSKGL